MKLKWINFVLLAGIGVGIALNLLVSRDFKQPNLMFFPEMVFSIPYNSFAKNPNFADGKTLQQPPAGSIARDYMPLHYAANDTDGIRAGLELTNPYSNEDKDAKLRGAYIYKDFCLPCHGPTGAVHGLISKRGYPPPPDLSLENGLKMKDGQMFHVLTYGKGNMPDYRAQVASDDRWKVILHVRELQEKALAEAELALKQAEIDQSETEEETGE